MERYKSEGYIYPKYYSVECPHCKKEATVEDWKFMCKHCFGKVDFPSIKYNIYFRRNCPDCGKQIYIRETGLSAVPEKMKVMCPNCLFKIEDKPTLEKCYKVKPDAKGLKTDPYYGFPLWFQTEVKGHLFWGYNREHLVEIEAYVKADLREVDINGRSYRMVTRLPSFIKEAKNRETVLKAIERMIKK